MMELVFDESAAGSLRQAKSHRPGDRETVGWSPVLRPAEGGAPPLKAPAPRWEERVWLGPDLGGGPGEVVCLSLGLSMGRLSGMEDPLLSERRAVLEGLWSAFRSEADFGEDWQRRLAELERLKAAIRAGEAVRMWYAPWCPEDRCGVAFACRLLEGADVPVSQVCLPRERVRGDGAACVYRGLGEVAPEALAPLSAGEAVLAPSQRLARAMEWRRLAEENAPLRAVVNGELVSVPADFYDFALLAALPAGETVPIGPLLGRVLGGLPGVGDGWLYLRLLALRDAGVLRCTPPVRRDRPYSAAVGRA